MSNITGQWQGYTNGAPTTWTITVTGAAVTITSPTRETANGTVIQQQHPCVISVKFPDENRFPSKTYVGVHVDDNTIQWCAYGVLIEDSIWTKVTG